MPHSAWPHRRFDMKGKFPMYPFIFSARTALSLGTLALLGVAALPASAQIVRNAGFEAPSIGANYVYNPPAASAAWTFSANTNGISGSGISGNNTLFTSSNSNAPEGVQVGFVQEQGSVSQNISGFATGDYTFQFQAAQRATGAAALENIQVLVDNTPLYGANGLLPAGTSYQLYTTSPILLSAGSHTLTFQGLNTAYIGTGHNLDNTLFLDAVAINPVPEASTAVTFGLLLALGLGGVIVAARKKKSQGA